MGFIEKASELLESKEFSEGVNDFMKNVIGAATGDIVAVAEALMFILKSPMFIRECLFWEKFAMFLDGVFLEEEDVKKLSQVFVEIEEKEDYARRVIKVIDNIETKDKVTYIINLTRALLEGHIIKADYFRLINAIGNTLDEDLEFLKEAIGKKQLKANIHFEFLKQNGLAIQYAVSDEESDGYDVYIFTPFAEMLDKYGLNYCNGKYKYDTTTERLDDQPVPVTKAGSIIARFG